LFVGGKLVGNANQLFVNIKPLAKVRGELSRSMLK